MIGARRGSSLALAALTTFAALVACGGSDDVSVGRLDPKPSCAAGFCHINQACTLVIADCASVPGQAALGPCTRRPTDCSPPDPPEWICGCDGHSYETPCLAATAGVGVASTGKCPAP